MAEINRQQIEALIHTGSIVLLPTQPALCIPIINRLYQKMKVGVPFAPIKMVADMISEGHHRYIASLLAQIIIRQDPAIKTAATINRDWETVTLEEDDWDDADLVAKYTQQDAKAMGITVHDLTELMQM